MNIVGARTTVVGTPWRELVFLELVTDDGLTGVSEVRMVNKTSTLLACLDELAPRYVIDTDPFDVERLAWNVLRAEYGRPGEITQSALAAFDVACWDLMGQRLGVPVWKLLGGRFRDRVPAYANGWYQADRDPKSIATLARAVVERGYRALKLDPFGSASAEIDAANLRQASAIVAAVRDAVGPDVQILVEMHGRFTPAMAIKVAARLEPYDPEWIEEPVPPENPQATARVRAATRLAIATGERAHTTEDIRPFIEQGLVDVVQVDLTHFGGFGAMKRLAGWADAYSLLLAPHNVCGPVGTMANVHLGVATPNYKVLEHFNDFADPWVQELVDAPPAVDRADGCFAAPDKPGLGVRLNHDACANHPRTGGRIQLFQHGWEKREGRSKKAEGRSTKGRMTRDDVELVFDAKAELGEGPVWDAASECLYFVDIERSRVHRFHATTHASRTYDAGSMVGAVALAEAGDLVMAVCHGFARLDLDTGRVRMIADVEAGRQNHRMNDGKCDAAGRFWAGTMAFDYRRGAGALYRLDPDGRVHTMLRDVTISNGLDWTEDGRRMYYIDTPTKSIDVFDFDAARGAIANRRAFVQVPDRQGSPDGMTLDAEGGLWVAFWGGGVVRRYTPDGALDREIRLPVTQPTSCAFGGRDLRDLYITTAATTLSPEERSRQPHAGGVFRCRPGVQGRPANRFKG